MLLVKILFYVAIGLLAYFWVYPEIEKYIDITGMIKTLFSNITSGVRGL